ncbi:FGGY-family carbohydrate kinase [Streptomyces marispadix]|uniref:Carbohydrate kinase n=1 Tax=Streptomyces marispadix TaxID=2922868 RepID=A0ABS9T500_9ACTN|nr:FGGY-family carbohydrate kinase [Streptomyces marispadix]MCH6163528.1 carbohydrate kinase [Streptomyces marispadix]
MTVVVGVDVATAEIRATAVDPRGFVAATAARPLPPPARPRPGWSQQRACYVDEAFTALRMLAAQLGGRPVAGLAVTSTSGTIVPCDTRGAPTGEALLYDDRRTAPGAWNGELPSALGRIAWLEKHRPAPRYLHVADVVVAALAGEVQPADTSHALKSGADPETLRWPDRLLSRLGVSARAMPRLERPGVAVAEISATAAAHTALPAGTPIVLGMTDGCTGQIAAGAVTPGDAVSVLGTTLVVKAVMSTRPRAQGTAVYSHRAPDGCWWPGGASNVGAGVLASARPGPGPAAHDLAALDQAADANGPARVCCYPLTRRGERFPFDRSDAEGFWTGRPRDRVEEHRALLEGVAFTERLALTVLARAGDFGAGPLRAVGGASRSDVWLRIRATVTGRPVWVPEHPSSSFGAAVLAAAATVHGSLADAVAAMVRPGRTADPDDRQREALESSYGRFLAALRERGYLDGELAGAPQSG